MSAETDKIKNIDHEKIKRLPINHPVRVEMANALKTVLSGQVSFEELNKHRKDKT